jgi:ligand-binding sensor domain-containing protein
MNLQTRAFERFTTDDGLPNNVVYGVLPAGENLWLSTNRGLSVFNKSKETFRSFTTSEGLQHIEFNHSSFLKSEDGRLFFGGINGLNVFNPEEVLPNPTVPNTVITGIWVKCRSINLCPLRSRSGSGREI